MEQAGTIELAQGHELVVKCGDAEVTINCEGTTLNVMASVPRYGPGGELAWNQTRNITLELEQPKRRMQ